MSAALIVGGITVALELFAYVIALLCGVDPLGLFWRKSSRIESTCVVLPFPSADD